MKIINDKNIITSTITVKNIFNKDKGNLDKILMQENSKLDLKLIDEKGKVDKIFKENLVKLENKKSEDEKAVDKKK